MRGRSVLDAPHEEWVLEVDLGCPDELEDPLVDSLVELVANCYVFKKKMFKGGYRHRHSRLRSMKQKEKDSKEKNDKDNSGDYNEADTVDQTLVLTLLTWCRRY